MEQQEILRSWILPGPYIPECADDGRYNPMQCQGQYCYCVNEYGVELVESRVHITEGKPHCYDGGNILLFSLRFSKKNKIFKETFFFHYRLLSLLIFGISFFFVIQITNQFISSGALMTLCQSQFQEFLRQPIPGRYEPRCSSTGAFQDVQCHGKECFCVNREGSEIPNTRQTISMGKLVCPKQGDQLIVFFYIPST